VSLLFCFAFGDVVAQQRERFLVGFKLVFLGVVVCKLVKKTKELSLRHRVTAVNGG
jgi:uncharacterized membrane protein